MAVDMALKAAVHTVMVSVEVAVKGDYGGCCPFAANESNRLIVSPWAMHSMQHLIMRQI